MEQLHSLVACNVNVDPREVFEFVGLGYARESNGLDDRQYSLQAGPELVEAGDTHASQSSDRNSLLDT